MFYSFSVLVCVIDKAGYCQYHCVISHQCYYMFSDYTYQSILLHHCRDWKKNRWRCGWMLKLNRRWCLACSVSSLNSVIRSLSFSWPFRRKIVSFSTSAYMLSRIYMETCRVCSLCLEMNNFVSVVFLRNVSEVCCAYYSSVIRNSCVDLCFKRASCYWISCNIFKRNWRM